MIYQDPLRIAQNGNEWRLWIMNDVPRTENVATIPAVVSSLCKTESDTALSAALYRIIFQPVISNRSSGHVRYTPGMHTASCIANQHSPVISGRKKMLNWNFLSGKISMNSMSKKTNLETEIKVTEAGSLLSGLSYAVCIVNLLRNISWRCHMKPKGKVRLPNQLIDSQLLLLDLISIVSLWK